MDARSQTCSQGRRSQRKESQRGLMDARSQTCSQGRRSPRKESQRGLMDARSQTCSQGGRSPMKDKSVRSDRVVTCSQTRRDLKRKPQGFRGYRNWIRSSEIDQIRPSRGL